MLLAPTLGVTLKNDHQRVNDAAQRLARLLDPASAQRTLKAESRGKPEAGYVCDELLVAGVILAACGLAIAGSGFIYAPTLILQLSFVVLGVVPTVIGVFLVVFEIRSSTVDRQKHTKKESPYLIIGWSLGELFRGSKSFPKEAVHEITEFAYPFLGLNGKLYLVMRTETVRGSTQNTYRVTPNPDISILDWEYGRSSPYGNDRVQEVDATIIGRRSDCPIPGDGLLKALQELAKRHGVSH